MIIFEIKIQIFFDFWNPDLRFIVKCLETKTKRFICVFLLAVNFDNWFIQNNMQIQFFFLNLLFSQFVISKNKIIWLISIFCLMYLRYDKIITLNPIDDYALKILNHVLNLSILLTMASMVFLNVLDTVYTLNDNKFFSLQLIALRLIKRTSLLKPHWKTIQLRKNA